MLGGYRFTDERLTATTPPRPVNPYGVSKLLIERVGIATGARTGMSFLALRIGYCQPGDDVPGPAMLYGRWGQEMWLSNQRLGAGGAQGVHLVVRGVGRAAPHVGQRRHAVGPDRLATA